jgi:hypothetical protein
VPQGGCSERRSAGAIVHEAARDSAGPPRLCRADVACFEEAAADDQRLGSSDCSNDGAPPAPTGAVPVTAAELEAEATNQFEADDVEPPLQQDHDADWTSCHVTRTSTSCRHRKGAAGYRRSVRCDRHARSMTCGLGSLRRRTSRMGTARLLRRSRLGSPCCVPGVELDSGRRRGASHLADPQIIGSFSVR